MEAAEEAAARINARVARRQYQQSPGGPSAPVAEYEITPAMIEAADATLLKDVKPVPPFWKAKYEREVAKNWDRFYKQNTANFFKDRMWVDKEFDEIREACEARAPASVRIVELGCGVGNTIIPLLYSERRGLSDRGASLRIKNDAYSWERDFDPLIVPFFHLGNKNLEGVAVDCASRAVKLLQGRWDAINSGAAEKFLHARKPTGVVKSSADVGVPVLSRAAAERDLPPGTPWPGGILKNIAAFDITESPIPDHICSAATADFVLLIFVLSALPPTTFVQTLKNAALLLKPGGTLIIRDYARYDMTQLRFAESKRCKVDENLYVRQDGTLSYFFTAEELVAFATQEHLLDDISVE